MAKDTKEQETIRYRPFLNIIKKSPFEALTNHTKKVESSVHALRELIELYCKCEFEKAEAKVDEINKLEREADVIEADIREHLPRRIFMQVSRGEIGALLKEQDAIADLAEDIAFGLTVQRTDIPPNIKKGLLKQMRLLEKTMDALHHAVFSVNDLLRTGFRKKDVESIRKILHDVGEREHELDLVKRDLKKKLYALKDEYDAVTIFQILRVVDRIDNIADHAENVEDWLRAITAR